MRRLLKWLLGALAILAGLAVVGTGAAYYYLKGSVPPANGELRIAGLGAPVKIVYDAHGVPHIIAETLRDAAMGQGFVHARDRLWQMEMFRIAGEGRLSEIFGEKTIATDIYMRTIDIAGRSRRSYERLDDETKAMLRAYVAGINAWLERETGSFRASLPPEFLILGHEPRPWRPWQPLMTVKLMAQTLGTNLHHELQRLALARRGFSPSEIAAIVRTNKSESPPPLPDLRTLYGWPVKQAQMHPHRKRLAKPFGLSWPSAASASNNWVVAGSRTKTGKVLLANDPHLRLGAPSIWYAVHLSWQEEGRRRHAIGMSLPSTPMVVLGRNDRVAWGFTNTGADVQDLYIEKLHPRDPNRYKTPEGWAEFEREKITIKVKDAEDVTFIRRQSRHGPILPTRYAGLDRLLPKGYVAAIRWTALADDDTTIAALSRMARARNVEAYIEAQRLFVAPMQSMVVGDVDGNIGFITAGRLPLRKAENDLMGRAPAPGWDGRYDWAGFLPFDQLVKIVNPPSGVLYSANANILPPGYPHHYTFDWTKDFRQERVRELVAERKAPHDMASMISAQTDRKSKALLELRDKALRAIGNKTDGIPVELLSALRRWDGEMLRARPEPLIMIAWFKALQEAIFRDDLGEDYARFAKGDIAMVLGAFEAGPRNWCDNRETSAIEDCGGIARRALEAALAGLEKRYGGSWQTWRWGRAHMAHGAHRPFDNVPPLAKWFNVLVESGGGPYTVLRGQTDFRKEPPFHNYHASSYRGVFDLSDLDNSLWIHTTGQSGNPLSPHYRDLAPLWAEMKYLPMTTKPDAYEANAEGVWLLRPER